MRRVFIVGFGKFGRAAFQRLKGINPKLHVWAIDRRPQAFGVSPLLDGADMCRVIADGPAFLHEFRDNLRDDDFIIPALPVHLAREWLMRIFGSLRSVPPPPIGHGFPFRKRIGHGLYLSYADFLCPEDCPAPSGHCYHTGQRRPLPLWKYLKGNNIEVILSRQLAPGVGGYPFGELKRLETSLRKGSFPFILATACRCHGVIHAFQC